MNASADAENWRAFVRFISFARNSPLVVGLACLTIGGSGGTLLANRKEDPRIDSLLVMSREMKPKLAAIDTIQEILGDHELRLALLEPKKIAPEAVRIREISGRRRER